MKTILKKEKAVFAIAALLSLSLLAGPSNAQEIILDLGDDVSLSERIIQIILFVTALSFLPGLVMMVTSFPFFVTVFAILKQGLGLQTAPPSMLIVSLSLFLTFFVMEPVLTSSWANGVRPLLDGELSASEAVKPISHPFRVFMEDRVDTEVLERLTEVRQLRNVQSYDATGEISVLVPSFLISEIQRAFQVGFLIYLPFLVIDLVVAAILMAMGMMMVPPAMVSLPFKLAFFVAADGFTLISEALIHSYY